MGTPGRVHDLVKRGIMSLVSLRILILDAADELVVPNFYWQIETILKSKAPQTPLSMFSTRWTINLSKIEKFMTADCKRVKIEDPNYCLNQNKNLRQYYLHDESHPSELHFDVTKFKEFIG